MSKVRLPTSKLVLLLLGLCRQPRRSEVGDGRAEDEVELEERDGWLYRRWVGLRGGIGMVGVPADNETLVAALRRTVGAPRAYVELAAILAMLAALGGRQGAWCLERVAELLYGKRLYAKGHDKSHRERQLPPIKGWLALLEHGYWQLDVGDPSRPAKRKRKSSDGIRTLSGSLLRIEQHRHGSATAHVADGLAADLRGGFAVLVPAALFLLPRKDHHNPWGNTPSLATRARLRLAGAIASKWRAQTGQVVSGEELLEVWAALDVGRVAERGRVRAWVSAAEDELLAAADHDGPGLAERPAFERAPLATRFRLLLQPRRPATAPAPAHPLARPGRARSPG